MATNSPTSKRLFWYDQNGICPLCKEPLDFNQISDSKYANIDHIIPKSHGGSDARKNLQLAHTLCNLAKGCGCGPNGHDYRIFWHDLWRAQGFCCGVYSEPLQPSEIFDQTVVRVVDGKIGHIACFYKFGVEHGVTRNLVPPKGAKSC